MIYPKYVYCANEALTRTNMKEYDRKKKHWYDVAETLFPDYFKRTLKERVLELKPLIDEVVGYSL